MGGGATIVCLRVVEINLVEALLEGFQGLFLRWSKMADVAREQPRIIRSVDVWELEFGHILETNKLPDRYRADRSSATATWFTSPYLFPTANRNLSITAFPLRRFNKEIRSLGRCAWSYARKTLNKLTYGGVAHHSQNSGQEGDARHDS